MPAELHAGVLQNVLREFVSTAGAESKEFASLTLLGEMTYQRLLQMTDHLPPLNPLRVAGAFHMRDKLTSVHLGQDRLLTSLKTDVVNALFHDLDETDPLEHFRRLSEGNSVQLGAGRQYRPAYFELLQQQQGIHNEFVAAVKSKAASSWKQQAILKRVIARWQAMLVDRLFCAWRKYGAVRDRRCDAVVAVMKRKTRRIILRQYLGFWKNNTKRAIQADLGKRLNDMNTKRENDARRFKEDLLNARTESEDLRAQKQRLVDEVRRLEDDLLAARAKMEELHSKLDEEHAEKTRWKNLACSMVQSLMPRTITDPEEVLFAAQSAASAFISSVDGVSPALLAWNHDAVAQASAEKLLLAWLNGVRQRRLKFNEEVDGGSGDNTTSAMSQTFYQSAHNNFSFSVNSPLQAQNTIGPQSVFSRPSSEPLSDTEGTLQRTSSGNSISREVGESPFANVTTPTLPPKGRPPSTPQQLIRNFEEDFRSGENLIRILDALKIIDANGSSEGSDLCGPSVNSASILTSLTSGGGNAKEKRARTASAMDQVLAEVKHNYLGFEFPISGLDFAAGNPSTAYLFFSNLLEYTHRTVLDPVEHAPPLQSGEDCFPDTRPTDCREMFLSILEQQSKWTSLIQRTRGHAYQLLANRATVIDQDAVEIVLSEGLVNKFLTEKHPAIRSAIRSLQDVLDEIALGADEVRRIFACYSTEHGVMTHAKYSRFLADCKLYSKTFPKKTAASLFDFLLRLKVPGEDLFRRGVSDDGSESPSPQGTPALSRKPSMAEDVRKKDLRVSTASGPGETKLARGNSESNLKRTGSSAAFNAATTRSTEDTLEGTSIGKDDNASDEESVTALSVKHFVAVLLHLALLRDGTAVADSHQPSRALGKAFSHLLEHIGPLAGSSGIDEFKDRVYRKDVQQVLASYERGLTKVFAIIGGADDDPEMSFPEFLQMVKDAKLLDAHFPADDAKKLFAFLMDGDINAGMVYREFLEAVVALCDYRCPSPWIPLPDRLKTFLKTIFFPPLQARYKALKKRIQ